jgi:hypothetical protein
MTLLWFGAAEMHRPKIQLCGFEGVDVSVKNRSDAVCSNQTWGNSPLSFGNQWNVCPSLLSRDP